jgi:magnesium-protoporphyrin IX monomethyl ester (oxidative) cyclase
MGWRTALAVSRILAGQLMHGQTNFLRMLFKFSSVYNAKRQFADHFQPVVYEMRRPEQYARIPAMREVVVHERLGGRASA